MTNRPIITAAVGALMLLCLCCHGTRSQSIREWEGREWQRLKTNDRQAALGYESYYRSVPGTKVREYRITGELAINPQEAVHALREKSERADRYLDAKIGFVEVLESTPTELLTYSVYRLPWPFRDRSMRERFHLQHNADTGERRIEWISEWAGAQPVPPGVVRMPDVHGSWVFKPRDGGGCRATYTVYADPGGRFPTSLFNATVRKGLGAELTGLESLAKSLRRSAGDELLSKTEDVP